MISMTNVCGFPVTVVPEHSNASDLKVYLVNT